MPVVYLGNKLLLEGTTVGFLSSRNVSSGAVLRCYDWATDVAGTVGAVVSGFHADIERDVLRLLLQQQQPVIMVLARALYKELPTELHALLDAGRLLCISTAPRAVRVGRSAALYRNEYIAKLSDRLVFGYISPESALAQLYDQYRDKAQLL